MHDDPRSTDPRKVLPMPARRNYPPQDRYPDNRDPQAFSNVQLATILTRLEEGFIQHGKSIDAQSHESQRMTEHINQLLLAVRSVTDSLGAIRDGLTSMDTRQSTIVQTQEADHTAMRLDIQTTKNATSAHELRITALEQSAKTSGNRLFEIGSRSIGWIIAAVAAGISAIQFLASHYKP
jgi:hypothetical protein